jgi:hypothetical protein
MGSRVTPLPLAALVAIAGIACTPPPAATSDAGPSASSVTSSASAIPSIALSLVPPPEDLDATVPLSPRAKDALDKSLSSLLRIWGDTSPHATVADTFLVVGDDAKAPMAEAAKLTQQTFDALYAGPFRHRPDQAALAIIFSSHPRYAKSLPQGVPTNIISLWDPETRQILVDTSAAPAFSICHEVTHVLIEADAPKAPVYLSEGIASLLEFPDFSVPGEVHGKPHFRLATLRTALASPATAGKVRLDAMFGWLTVDDFQKPESQWALRQAVVRESMRWLDSKRHQLWTFYHRFREGVIDDPTGLKAFTAVVGPPADVTAEWIAWLQSEEAAR